MRNDTPAFSTRFAHESPVGLRRRREAKVQRSPCPRNNQHARQVHQVVLQVPEVVSANGGQGAHGRNRDLAGVTIGECHLSGTRAPVECVTF